MGSRAYLRIGELVLSETNREIDPSVMMLFTKTDKHISKTKVDSLNSSTEKCIDVFITDEDEVTFEYRASLGVVKDRLEFMGFTLDAVKAAFRAGVEEELVRNEERFQQRPWVDNAVLSVHLTRTDALLRKMSFESWLKAFTFIIREHPDPSAYLWYDNTPAPELPEDVRYLLGGAIMGGVWFPSDDFRTLMRAAVEVTGTIGDIVYDLSELVAGEYVDVEEDLCEWARRTTAEDFTSHHKVIVLTEGFTDKQALEGSLRLLYPHLAEYYSFMDFDGAKAPGGAGVLSR